MTFRMIVQLWNTNTSAFVSCDGDLTENYMYISMKFGTGVHVFCWEVGVFNRSSFQSVSYNMVMKMGCTVRHSQHRQKLVLYNAKSIHVSLNHSLKGRSTTNRINGTMAPLVDVVTQLTFSISISHIALLMDPSLCLCAQIAIQFSYNLHSLKS